MTLKSDKCTIATVLLHTYDDKKMVFGCAGHADFDDEGGCEKLYNINI